MTENKQHPTSFRPRAVSDFAVAELR